MKLIIDIDEDVYKLFTGNGQGIKVVRFNLENALKNGTPLPKGHGDLIDRDHMIARLETASKFFGGEHTDAFDERFSQGLKEAAIKVAEEPTIIEADKGE